MKKYTLRPSLILLIAVLCSAQACSPNLSYETDTKEKIYTSSGYLRDSVGGICMQSYKLGGYRTGSTLDPNINKVAVSIYALRAGTYKIWTDTVNGFWFRDSGYVEVGTQAIFLKGNGTPQRPVYSIFKVQYGTSYCEFSIPVY